MFLPSFSAFLLAAACLVSSACDGPAIDGATPPPAMTRQADGTRPVATVTAGTGDVDGQWVARVDAVVQEELPRLLPLFGAKPNHKFFVHVHADRESLPDSLAAHLHPESPAFALLGQHQIHMVVGEIRRLGVDLNGVVRHELVHELLDQYAAPFGRGIPRWFHEGIAQHLAGDTYLRAREDDLAWLLIARRLLPFADLRTHFPNDVDALRSAYAQSYSYVSWMVREYGLDELLAVVRAVDDLTPFEPALAGRLSRSTAELEEAWRHYVLHGSGAPWRVLFEQCFSLSLLAILPLLVLALRRRLAKEDRAARALVATAAQAAAMAAATPTWNEPPLPRPDIAIEDADAEVDADAEAHVDADESADSERAPGEGHDPDLPGGGSREDVPR